MSSAPDQLIKPNSSSGHRARLRERFIQSGLEGFADYEVMELLLTLCIPRKDVKPQAKLLLQHFGTLKGVLDASTQELSDISGMGQVAPVALKIIKESADLYLQQSAEGQEVLNSSDRLERFWRSRMGGLKSEVFEVAYLDVSYKLMRNGVDRLEEGIADRTQVYPRKVMQAALRRSASSIVIAHNHPSGRAQPSEADIELTKALVHAGHSIGIRILDHMIITANGVFSFKRSGLID